MIRSTPARLVALGALAVITALSVLCLSGEVYSPAEVWASLSGEGAWLQTYSVLTLRAPRAALTLTVGAALALSGLLLQGVTRNPLADPGLLGVTAGAGLAVTALVATYPSQQAAPQWLLPVAAFAGALAAATVVLSLSGALGRGHPARLLLIGVACGAAAGAISQVMALSIRNDLFRALMAWQAGSLSGATWRDVITVLPVAALGGGAALALAHRMDVLVLGDELAVGLGVIPPRVRAWATLLAALLAAACVAVAGGLGFVGLFAPHIARGVVGQRHLALIPACAAIGATATCAADVVAHRAFPGMALPTGTVVAVVGVPWLIFNLARGRQV